MYSNRKCSRLECLLNDSLVDLSNVNINDMYRLTPDIDCQSSNGEIGCKGCIDCLSPGNVGGICGQVVNVNLRSPEPVDGAILEARDGINNRPDKWIDWEVSSIHSQDLEESPPRQAPNSDMDDSPHSQVASENLGDNLRSHLSSESLGDNPGSQTTSLFSGFESQINQQVNVQRLDVNVDGKTSNNPHCSSNAPQIVGAELPNNSPTHE